MISRFDCKMTITLAASASLLAISMSSMAFGQSNGVILPPPPQVGGRAPAQQNGGAVLPPPPLVRQPQIGGQQQQPTQQGFGQQQQPPLPQQPTRQGIGQQQQPPLPQQPTQQQQGNEQQQQQVQPRPGQPPVQQQRPQQPQPPVQGQLPTQQNPNQQTSPGGSTDNGLPDRVRLFSATTIDQVLINGRPADGQRVSDTVVEIFIVGDESGYPCTNTFDITFGDGRNGQLTANHCHGEVEFAVIPGQSLNHEEVHDGTIDERASGIETLSSDFQWSYYADATKTGLQFSVPETDNVMFLAECDRGSFNATVYALLTPDWLQFNQALTLTVVTDGGASENYGMGVWNFPYLEGGPVPGMQIGVRNPFFENLAGGQIADFYVSSETDQTSIRVPLKGSAKPVRSFVAACSSR